MADPNNGADGSRGSWFAMTVADGPSLQLEYRTWHRDSHELFDYESQHIYKGRHILRRSTRVYRNGNEVTTDEEDRRQPLMGDYLLSVKARDGRFFIFPADRNNALPVNVQPKKLWLITRYLPDNLYPLSEGDVIKLGRFKLRIKQIVPEDSPNVLVDYRLDDSEYPAVEDSVASGAAPDGAVLQCRICLTEGSEEGNPLVCACQCKGSIMHVHLDCLRHWVNGRLNLSEDLSRSCCFVKQIQCELCKATFPSFVTCNGEKLPVIKIPQLQPPFIVLENMVGPTNKGVHLCSLAQKKECKLGRGHESDVRIADVSISRWHATIKYSDGVFNLEDHNSKFGTLVAIRKPIVIGHHVERLSVQVGRTVMDLSHMQPLAAEDTNPVDSVGLPNALRNAVHHLLSDFNSTEMRDSDE